MIKCIIYDVEVIATRGDSRNDKKSYIGLRESELKTRYDNHIASFRHKDKSKATKLANHVRGF